MVADHRSAILSYLKRVTVYVEENHMTTNLNKF